MDSRVSTLTSDLHFSTHTFFFLARAFTWVSLCRQGETGMMHDGIVRSAPEALERSFWHDSPMDQIKPADQQWPHNVTSPDKRSTLRVNSKLDPVTTYSHVNCVLWSHYQWHRFIHSSEGLCLATQSPLIYETRVCVCAFAQVFYLYSSISCISGHLHFHLSQHTENNDNRRSIVPVSPRRPSGYASYASTGDAKTKLVH